MHAKQVLLEHFRGAVRRAECAPTAPRALARACMCAWIHGGVNEGGWYEMGAKVRYEEEFVDRVT